MPLALNPEMDESPASESCGTGFLKSLVSDRPWDSENSRQVLFLNALLGGLLAGAAEGVLLCDSCFGLGYGRGDATFWDTVASGSWIGAGAGAAAGLALILAQNLFTRALFAALGGAVAVPAALYLSWGGIPVGAWEGNFLAQSTSLLTRPLGWGLYLGTFFASTLAIAAHLTRRSARRVRLLLPAAALTLFFGARSQTFFWYQWDLGRPSLGKSAAEILSLPAGILSAIAMIAVVLLLIPIGSRMNPRTLAASLGAILALLALGIGWATRTMAFTTASEFEDIAFSTDGRSLISLHEGNAIRHWTIEERGPDQEPALKETFRARIPTGTPWRNRSLLRPPYLASVTRHGLRLWDAGSGQSVAILPLPDADWDHLAFSSSGRFVGVQGAKACRVWDLEDDAFSLYEFPQRRSAENSTPMSLCLTDDGSPYFTVRHQRFHEPAPRASVAWTHNVATLSTGAEILAAKQDGKSYLWNAARVGAWMTFTPPMGDVRWSCPSPDDRLLILATDVDLWIVDLDQAKVLIHEDDAGLRAGRVAASPDDRWIVALINERPRIWRWPQSAD